MTANGNLGQHDRLLFCRKLCAIPRAIATAYAQLCEIYYCVFRTEREEESAAPWRRNSVARHSPGTEARTYRGGLEIGRGVEATIPGGRTA